MGRQHPAPASKVRIRLFIAVPSVKIKKDNPQANALWVVFVFRFPQGRVRYITDDEEENDDEEGFNSRSAGKIHRQKQRRIRLPDLVHLCKMLFLSFIV